MRLNTLALLALLSLPASAQRLLIVSGDAQLVPEQFQSNQPMVVRAVNAAGQPVSNVPVTWQGPALGFSTRFTDEKGEASAVVGGLQLFQGESYLASKYTVTAEGYGSAEFTETTFSTRTRIGGAPDRFHPDLILLPSGLEFVGPPGTVIPRAFGVRLLAAGGLNAGSPIPNVSLRIRERERDTDPIVSCQGPGGIVLTNAAGEAYCDLVLGSTPAVGTIRAIVGEDLVTGPMPVSITEGPTCTYTVTPPTQAFTSGGSGGTITVTAGQGCNWTASTSSNWITITGGASRQGNGTVSYTVAPNTGGLRSGTIQIADRQVTITQAATGGGTGGGTLTIASASPISSGTVNSAYSYQFNGSGGTAPYIWSVASGNTPPGFILNATTGVLSGTPAVAGTYNFTISLRDAANTVVTAPFVMTVSQPGGGGSTPGQLQITTTSIPAGVVGTAYSQNITAVGACVNNPFVGAVVNWTVLSGSLPPGLSISRTGSSATISGTPSLTGSFNFTVQASDSCGRVTSQAFSTTITSTTDPTPSQNLLTVTPANIEFSIAFSSTGASQQVSVQSGTFVTPFTVATTTPWVRVSKSAGTTPDSFVVEAFGTGSFAPGTYNGTITITSGATNGVVTVPVTLRVASAANVTVTPQSLTFQHALGAPFSSQTLNISSVAAGAQTPFTVDFEAEGGGGWLSVNPANGQTPRTVSVVVDTSRLAVGTYRGAIRVRPTGNASGTVVIPVTAVVTPASTLSVAQRQLTFNGPGTQSLALSSTGAPLNFTAETSGAPWLSVSPASGVTPGFLNISTNASGLAPGTYSGTVLVNSGTGGTDTVQISVTLNVTAGQPTITGVTNAASFATGAVAPGELVTLFGTNLGPTTLVSGTYDASGTLPTTVGGVQVLFDNVAAPVIYASSGQVSTIVPFAVVGRTTTRVQVVKDGLTSNTLDLNIADAAPGIFVLDNAGQGAILNPDLSVNGQLNGAEPGAVIAIYATGAGRMEGTLPDGRIVQGTPKPLLPVGVRIGGRIADVTYQGAAPGLVAGMLQVNARIPEDTPRGTMVPVQITVGATTSQTNVFVATKP